MGAEHLSFSVGRVPIGNGLPYAQGATALSSHVFRAMTKCRAPELNYTRAMFKREKRKR